jgi:hypothetical protein
MTDDQFNPSRRKFVANIACLPALTSADGLQNTRFDKYSQAQDTKLISLGLHFDRLTRTWDDAALKTHNTYDNFDIVALIESINPIEAGIVSTQAKTIDGLLVKAHAANWSREGRINPEYERSTDQKMAWSIVRDLIQWSKIA